MKTFLRIVALLIITGIVGIILFYEWHPDRIPQKNKTPNQSVTDVVDNTGQSANIPISIIIISENSSTTPQVSIEYPQFSTLGPEVNNIIKSAVENRLADFRVIVRENTEARRATAVGDDQPSDNTYSFVTRWQPAQINTHYISLIIRFDSYVGGANENQELITFNYNIGTNKTLSLGDLFASSTDYLSLISTEARKQLRDTLSKNSNNNAPTETIDTGTEPVLENFKNFTFTDSFIQIYFPKYSVAPGAFGEQHITIPREVSSE